MRLQAPGRRVFGLIVCKQKCELLSSTGNLTTEFGVGECLFRFRFWGFLAREIFLFEMRLRSCPAKRTKKSRGAVRCRS